MQRGAFVFLFAAVFAAAASAQGTALVLELKTLIASTQVCIPMQGSLSLSVNWGDGTAIQTVDVSATINCLSNSAYPGVPHTYADVGTYIISMDRSGSGPVWLGQLGNIGQVYWDQSPGVADKFQLTRVLSFGDLGTASLKGAFAGCTTLTEIPATIPPNVTDLTATFLDSTNLNLANISSWDVSKVTKYDLLFQGCSSFNLPLGSWNVFKGTSMSSMFAEASAFNQPIASWNLGAVTDMSNMFNQPLGRWNENVCDEYERHLQRCNGVQPGHW
jgi:surface protein